jgi:hypothetical protein
MSAFLWWRSWHGAPMDHKWSVIASRSGVKAGIVSAVAWVLMDYASQHKDRGSIDGFDIEEYAVFSGFSEGEISAVIQAMNDKGIITNNQLTNWQKRQPLREDDSTPRVTKFRELKRSVTQGNAESTSVTSDSLSISESVSISESNSSSDPFDVILNYIQTKTGYPPVGGDISVINEFISRGVIKDDIDAAFDFLHDKKVVRGAQDLQRSVYVAMAKRIQNGNGHGGEISVRRGEDDNIFYMFIGTKKIDKPLELDDQGNPILPKEYRR